MSKQESTELSIGLKGAIAVAIAVALLLAVAPREDALQPIAIAQAAMPVQSDGYEGNGPTGYFPDRFRAAEGEDVPQPETF